MPSIYRLTAIWSGFQGAPGYTRMTFQGLVDDTKRNAAGLAMRTFFYNLTQFGPTGSSVSVQTNVQEFDVGTGVLLNEVAMTSPPAPVANGAGVNPYAAGSGYSIGWKTTSIFNGRRIAGRTYMVPALGCFENDGSLSTAAISQIGTAANALIADTADFSVWAKQMTTAVPPVQIGGQASSVTSYVLKDQASQLRSRRT